MSEIDYIGADELVFNNNNGIYSGGYSVNSIMMKGGMSPIITINQSGGGESNNVSDLFKDLVVPSWTINYNMKGGEYKEYDKNEKYNDDSDSDIDDDLHDKLLGLVKEHENKLTQNKQNKLNKQKITRKQVKNSKNGTKRNREKK
jgi:hypothetical protein